MIPFKELEGLKVKETHIFTFRKNGNNSLHFVSQKKNKKKKFYKSSLGSCISYQLFLRKNRKEDKEKSKSRREDHFYPPKVILSGDGGSSV